MNAIETSGATRLGSAFAPAKINLALHVTGRRPDGYHELDSLVVFAEIGDTVEAFAADGEAVAPPLAIEGPFGAALAGASDNLVHRASEALASAGVELPALVLRLIKNLPVASGIGGGSADAAATLRLLAALAPSLPPPGTISSIAAMLGSDVPMCLHSVSLRARGRGEAIEPWLGLPRLPMVLVNPGIAISTPRVFERLARRDNPPIGEVPAQFVTPSALALWLRDATRNDLETPAISEAPVIAAAEAALLGTDGCLMARMSGSGATLFGLYADESAADRAAAALAEARPSWWIRSTTAA